MYAGLSVCCQELRAHEWLRLPRHLEIEHGRLLVCLGNLLAGLEVVGKDKGLRLLGLEARTAGSGHRCWFVGRRRAGVSVRGWCPWRRHGVCGTGFVAAACPYLTGGAGKIYDTVGRYLIGLKHGLID